MENTSADQSSIIGVDNDNELVPENIPKPGLSVDYCQYTDEWYSYAICFRRVIGAKKRKGKLIHRD